MIHSHLILKAIILGVVEGLTEFLPISSTGHLILVNQWISFSKQFTELFDIVVQFGAILAVIIYFWKKIFPLVKGKLDAGIMQLWTKVVVAVLPALVIGAVAAKHLKVLFNPLVVATALIVGGIIIIWVEQRQAKKTINSLKALSYGTALSIGFIQCLSMIPGTSRSAATIIGAMLLGASRIVAAEFSFFLAIPTIFAASAFSLLKADFVMSNAELGLLAWGFITSFFVALIVIDQLMKFISKHDFKVFGWYRIVLGIIVLAYFIPLLK
jgi:undecaprenyl-diphosphatase